MESNRKTGDMSDIAGIFAGKKVNKNAKTKKGEQVKIIFNIDSLAKRQLDILAAEEGSNKTYMIHEALNDLFEKYGKERIA